MTDKTADRDWLIQRLMEMPAEIEAAESEVIQTAIDVEVATIALRDKEAALYNEGKYHLAALTASEQTTVTLKERDLSKRRLAYNHKRNEFSALKAIARLIPGLVELKGENQ